ncbi:hypothetical protein HPB51_004219 [Rhipicephalus microplus]|uniref:Uncharacterized protein n=1 Tax=Rhipicephalus microplus TaxID=6941 RepID=A0A9J6DYL9_RHIMP|nr:hypothetical protein HPB51_004219 [Rhipicephalus microplus]
MPRFTGFVLRYFRDTNDSLMWMDLDSGIRIVNVYAPGDFRSQKKFFAVLDDHLVGPSRVVLVGDFNCVLDRIDCQTFRGAAPKWTDRNGEAVLGHSGAVMSPENLDLLDFIGLPAATVVSVCVYEYPAEASDKVLSRALEVYGKVQNMSDDNLTGLHITTGNRRARMELRSPVPNITDVDGHVVRCEYDGVVRLCRKCRLRGHERKMCTTLWCARCQQWGYPTCDAPCKRCGGDHPPHLCKQRLCSEAATRPSVPQVAPPVVVSAEGQGAPAPTISDKGEQDKALEAAPGEAEAQKKKEEARPSSPKQAAQPAAPSPRDGKKPSPSVVKGRGRSPGRRKRGSSRARAAAAASARSTSSSDSRCSESASPEYKRHAATAVVNDDSSSSTTVEDSEMDAGSPTTCDS